jgi:hypothetical protein
MDMFVVTTVGRTIVGLLSAFLLGELAFLAYSVSVPPFSGLSIQTFAVVNSMAFAVVIGTGLAFYKWEAEWQPRLIMLGLIVIGAFVGGWIGYDYGFDIGIEKIKAEYGRIPGGEIRFPTHDGIRASLAFGILSANALAVSYHAWRLFRSEHPSENW